MDKRTAPALALRAAAAAARCGGAPPGCIAAAAGPPAAPDDAILPRPSRAVLQRYSRQLRWHWQLPTTAVIVPSWPAPCICGPQADSPSRPGPPWQSYELPRPSLSLAATRRYWRAGLPQQQAVAPPLQGSRAQCCSCAAASFGCCCAQQL